MDPRDIERRNLARMHNDASGVVGPAPGDNPPWINNVDVVNEIVRQFASEVLRKFSIMSTDDYIAWLKSECERLNQLFLGYQPDETRTDWKRGPWNTPDMMGQFVRLATKLDGENRFAVRDALMVMARDIVQTTIQHEGEDPKEWGWKLDGSMEMVANAILGLPTED